MIKPNTVRDEICSLALTKLDSLYIHGNMGPDTFDCAGFVWYVYNEILGINIFEDGYGLSTTTMIMTSNYGNLTIYGNNKNINLLNRGDIVLLHRQALSECEPKVNNKYPGHCGIYLGNKRFIHCSGTKKKVVINSFNNEYWYKKLVASKDIVNNIKNY